MSAKDRLIKGLIRNGLPTTIQRRTIEEARGGAPFRTVLCWRGAGGGYGDPEPIPEDQVAVLEKLGLLKDDGSVVDRTNY